MKEQGKNTPDQTNEKEIGSLPEKEFRVMIVKMIQNLGNRMEEIQEMFNKDLEELNSKQTMMNNTINEIKNSLEGGFPGGAVVKNLPANAGDIGSSPGPGKIPHAMELLSPCATTTESVLYSSRVTTTEACEPQLLKPTHLEPVLRNKRNHHNETPVHHNEE